MKKIILILSLLIFIIGCSREEVKNPQQIQGPEISEETTAQEDVTETIKETEPVEQVPSWKNAGVAISGKYADADIVDLGNGKYRMYYSAEPEVPGFKGQVYSTLSSDGMNWNNENG